MKNTLNITFLACVLFLLSWWGVSSLAFFNSDSGLRFWQAQELIASNWQTFAISYPGRFLDPNLEFIPLYCAYLLLNGEVYFSITPLLPLLASFFYAWLGTPGLAVVPVLAGVTTAAGAYKLAKLANLPRPNLILWSSVLATPLLFYTIQLWDHSLAMACAVWGVYCVALSIVQQKWQPMLWAGFITAVGLNQRPETYMLALALGIAYLIVARLRFRFMAAVVAGGLAGFIPLAWLQYRWTGHPLGVLMTHVSDYGRPDEFVFQCVGPPRSVEAGRFLLYIGGRDLWSFTAAMLVIIGLFLLIFWLRLPRLWNSKVVYAGLVAALVGYAMWARMLWQGALAGLLTTFPLLGLSLTYVDAKHDTNSQRSVYRLVLYTSLFFLAGMIIFWPAYGGNHWGARYLLPVYPLLIFLAFYVYTTFSGHISVQKTVRLVAAALLVASILLQLIGIRVYWRQVQENTAIQEAIAALPTEVILTNHPFLPTMLRGLDEQFFMYVDSEEDFETLIPRFVEHDISRFAFISLRDLPLRVPDQIDNITIRQISPVIYELDSSP